MWVSYRSPKPVSRLDEIEETFNHLKVPASFADQFYVLRVHVAFVRGRLKSATPG